MVAMTSSGENKAQTGEDIRKELPIKNAMTDTVKIPPCNRRDYTRPTQQEMT